MKESSEQLVRLDALTPSDGGLTLFGLDALELAQYAESLGEPAFRGRQLAEAVYRQRVADLSSISTLPKSLRQRLTSAGAQVGRPRIAQVFRSVDGTERYLIQCPGGLAETVETVWMPEGDDGEAGDQADTTPDRAQNPSDRAQNSSDRAQNPSDRAQNSRAPSFRRASGERTGNHDLPLAEPGAPSFSRLLAKRVGEHKFRPHPDSPSGGLPEGHRATICVSSQIGCAVNCQFCLTAKLGLQRNLTAGEIAGQVIEVFDRQHVEVGRDRVNLVFMGMGEPFLNYDNFMAAVRLLVEEVGLSPQRMTVSTSGIVPGIARFALEPAELRPKLAISLNAPNDAVRAEIMPINRKWPIEAVVDAVRGVRLRPRERVTFEYVLLGGVTDRPGHAQEVARLVRRTGLPAKVNLIAWNPGPGIAYKMPAPESVEAFREALIAAGVPAYLRKPRGRDIYAACGQLKRTVEG